MQRIARHHHVYFTDSMEEQSIKKINWLTLPGASDIPNCALQFHGIYNLSDDGTAPLLHIAAESYYVLYLNGQYVGRGPARGSSTLNFYDEWATAPFFHTGLNHLAVLVHSMNQRQNFNSYPAGCALGIDLGEQWRARLLPGWAHTTRFFTMQHGYKVFWDLRQHGDDSGWLAGIGTDQWKEAALFSSPLLDAKLLLPRDIPPLSETTRFPRLLKCAKVTVEPPGLHPDGTLEDIAELLNRESWNEQAAKVTPIAEQRWQATGNTALIFDFGAPALGFFECSVEAPRDGIQVHLTYGEELWHGRVRAAYPPAGDNGILYFVTDSYILHSGHNRIWHPFEQHGANLLQIEIRETGPGENVIIHNVLCRDSRYPYPPDGNFRCSDPLLERIWDLCCETMRACTADSFIDCPWREHAFWVNDLIVENRASLAIFGASDIHRHAFRLAFSQQNTEGWVTAVVPNFEKGGEGNVFPAANLFLFQALNDYLMASGDWETIRHYLPQLKDILEAAEATSNDTGLIGGTISGYNFFDWAFNNNGIDFHGMRDSMLNSLYFYSMCIYQKFAGVHDSYALSLNWRKQRIANAMASFLKDAPQFGGKIIEDLVIDTASETLPPTTKKLSCELAQALALSSGIWNDTAKQGMIRALQSGTLMQSELYLTGLVLQAMAENGLEAEALERIRKYWGRCVIAGYHSIPECAVYAIGRDVFRESGSLCHGFSTSPVVFFQDIILGIRAITPGYSEFSLDPRPLDLAYASGIVNTPHGSIFIKWQRADQATLKVHIEIPCGCIAILPDKTKLAAGTHNCLSMKYSEV